VVVLRILGWVLVAAALFLVGREALVWQETGDWAVIPTGQLWFELHRESLLLLQPVIERYIWPPLWDPGITTILQWPAWAAVGGLGLFLLLIASVRPGRRRA
jgi:hypothetical protein